MRSIVLIRHGLAHEVFEQHRLPRRAAFFDCRVESPLRLPTPPETHGEQEDHVRYARAGNALSHQKRGGL